MSQVIPSSSPLNVELLKTGANGMWKHVQYLLSLTADLFQIGGFFGITPAILVAVVTASIGWFSNTPPLYLVVAIVVVFAAAVYLTRQLIVRIGAISLADGARIAYEQLRGTLWGSAAERLRVDSSPDGILDYIATGLTLEVPVFGKFPPSTVLERVPSSMVKSGTIESGARILQLRDHHRSQITDLTIRKVDLHRAIRRMKEQGREG